MPASFGFGRGSGQIVQMAYVVEDVRQAIDWWVSDAGVGPWFLLDSFMGPDHVYRGEPSRADVAIAMGFSGDMNIELIQPKDDRPSVYRELIDRRGFGFHHIGIASEDVDRDIAAYEAKGYQLAFRAGVPTGGAVAYMDGGVRLPHFVELIPATAGFDQAMTSWWRQSRDWDGSDPVRPFA